MTQVVKRQVEEYIVQYVIHVCHFLTVPAYIADGLGEFVGNG